MRSDSIALLCALLLLPAACGVGAGAADDLGRDLWVRLNDGGWRAIESADVGSPHVGAEPRTEVPLLQVELIPLLQPRRCEPHTGALRDLELAWTPSGERRVYVGVFTVPPAVYIHTEDGSLQIRDTSTVVWAWRSSLDSPDTGRIRWWQGNAPGEGDGLPDRSAPPPTNLAPGVYWVATWAWNEARELVATSETRPFLWTADGQVTEDLCCGSEGVTAEGGDADWWCAPLSETEPPSPCAAHACY